MSTKQNPAVLDACALILHASQTDQSFEDYTDRVIRIARTKCNVLNKGLIQNEINKGKRK